MRHIGRVNDPYLGHFGPVYGEGGILLPGTTRTKSGTSLREFKKREKLKEAIAEIIGECYDGVARTHPDAKNRWRGLQTRRGDDNV